MDYSYLQSESPELICGQTKQLLKRKLSEKDSYLSEDDLRRIINLIDCFEEKSILLKESQQNYQALFLNEVAAFALHEIILNEKGEPCDYRFIEVNSAFLRLTGLENSNLIGKSCLDVLPDTEHYWIETYGKVALTGTPITFDNYSAVLNKHYHVTAYSPTPGKFATVFVDITQNKKNEELLLESETHYRNLANSGQGLIWTSGLDKKCNYFNETWLTFTGRTLEQELGDGWVESVHPDDLQLCIDTYVTAFDHQKKFSMEYRIMHASGKYRWIQDDGTPRYNSKGEFLGYIGHCLDVTQRKEAQEVIKESELRFKVIFEDAPDTMFLADPETGKIVDANSAACRLFKREKQELVGMFQYELHPRSVNKLSKDTFKEQYSKSLLNRKTQTIENKIVCSDGTEIPVEILAQHIKIGNKNLMLGTFRDITERKQAEQLLKISEEQFRAVFENSIVGKSLTISEGRLSVNKAFSDIVGYSVEELSGMKWMDITHKDDIDYNLHLIELILEGKIPSAHWEKRYIHKNGNCIWVDISTTLLPNPNGNERSFLTEIYDITDSKNAEIALQESEEKFKNAFTTNPDSINITQMKDGQFVSINSGFTRIMGYTEDDILGKTSMAINIWVNPSDREKLVMGLKEKGIVEDLVAQFRTKSGELIYGMMSASVIELDGIKHILSITRNITERKRIEDALHISESKLSEATQIANLCFWEYNFENDVFTFNDQFYKLYNTTAENEGGYLMSSANYTQRFVHPDDAQVVAAEIQKGLQSNELNFISNLDHRVICADGEQKDITVKLRVLKDLNKKIVRCYGVNQDITERKTMEKSLRRSKDRLNRGELVSKSGNWEIDLNSLTVKISRGTATIYGFTKKNLVYDEIKLPTLPEYLPMLDVALKNLIEKNEPYDLEFKIETKDTGEIKDVHSVALYDKRNRIVFGIVQDITDRKETEKALIESEKLLREAQQVAKLGSYAWDITTRTWTSSEILDKIFGINDAFEKTTENWLKIIHPEWQQIMSDYISDLVQNHWNFDKEYKIIRQNDGKECWVHELGQLEYNLLNEPIRLVGTITNIDERKEAEISLKEKMNDLMRFHSLTVGREIKMIELKKEINDLREKLGQEPKYRIVD